MESGKYGVVETVGRMWRVEGGSDEERKYGLVHGVESCSQRCSYAILLPTYYFVQFLLSESLGCHKPPPESFCKLILPSQVTMCACVMV